METMTSVHDRLILQAVQWLQRAENKLLSQVAGPNLATRPTKPVGFWLLLGCGLLLLVAATSATFMAADRVERIPFVELSLAGSATLFWFARANWKRWRAQQVHVPKRTATLAILAVALVVAGCSSVLVARPVLKRARHQRIEALVEGGKALGMKNAEVREQIGKLHKSPDSFESFYVQTRELQAPLFTANQQIAKDAAFLNALRREYFAKSGITSLLFVIGQIQQEDRTIAAALQREINCADGLYRSANRADQSRFRELCIAPNALDVDRASSRKLWLLQTVREKGDYVENSDEETIPIEKFATELNVL